MGGTIEPTGPELTQGVLEADVPDNGCLVGQAAGEPVLLVKQKGRFFAVGAACTHYGSNLKDGLVADDGTIRCPWHHACFSLETGAAVRAPALNPIPCWSIEQREGRVFVKNKLAAPAAKPPVAGPSTVVILGGGAAGHAAAETLRAEGYQGPVTIISAETSAPIDRPNVSKDYLAGNAPEEWMPLRPDEHYRQLNVTLRLGRAVSAIDTATRAVTLVGGESIPYGSLVIASGATANRLPIPGADRPHVFVVRTLADSRAIIARAAAAKKAVVIGSSFIGLEVAAALRARSLEVTVVSPDARPLEKVLGPAVGDFVRSLHESHGVVFRLSTKPAAIEDGAVVLEGGERVAADLVVMGVGVRPATELAERAGLRVDRGIVVDEYLQTSVPGVYAAGDVARAPDPATGELVRIEHWVVAQRQGALAARNVLGQARRNDIVPFFWSAHYDVTISYVGHAERWDEARVDGDLKTPEARIEYLEKGVVRAVATINRDADSLNAERAFELALAARR